MLFITNRKGISKGQRGVHISEQHHTIGLHIPEQHCTTIELSPDPLRAPSQ